jgi:hypothetical protein
MPISEIIHRLARLLALVVLGFAGTYVIVYLLRWEWNRALIAGLFFLAAELYLLGDVLLGRVNRLEAQLRRTEESEQISALAAQLRRHRPPPRGPFDWLTPDRDKTYVLVPILLGAGIILSAVAFVVERLSRVTAAPVAEHELARGLASMALPSAGLAPTGLPPADDLVEPEIDEAAERRSTAFLVGFSVVLTLAITLLAAFLVTRDAPPQQDAALVIDVAVARNNLDQPDEAVAAGVWMACQLRVPEEVTLQSLSPLRGEEYRLVIAPAPAKFDERELLGCLQDASTDRAQLRILDVYPVR